MNKHHGLTFNMSKTLTDKDYANVYPEVNDRHYSSQSMQTITSRRLVDRERRMQRRRQTSRRSKLGLARGVEKDGG